MLLKRMILFFILLTMVAAMASCGDTGYDKNARLTVYMLNYDRFISKAVKQFNKIGEYGTASTKSISNGVNQEYAKQLETELASGKGPDVIIADQYFLPQLSKLIKNGVFCDLNEFIKNDKSFNLSDYNQKIMDFGVIDGKRYLIPINYCINALFTTKRRLEENNIAINNNRISLDEFQRMSIDYRAAHPDDGTALTNYIPLTAFGSEKPLANVIQGKITIDSEYLKSMIPRYGEIASAFYPYDKMANGSGQVYIDGKIVFESSYLTTNTSVLPSAAKADDPVILPIPSFGGDNEIIARPMYVAAINSKCLNKKEAYELVKLLLSEDVQNASADYVFPVNNAALNAMLKEFSEGGGDDRGAIDPKAAQRIIEQMKPIINGNLKSRFIDTDAETLILEELVSVLNKTESIDDAVGSIDKKITDYGNSPIDIDESYAAGSSANPQQKTITVEYFEFQRDVANAIRAFNESRSDVQVKGTEIAFDPNNLQEQQTNFNARVMAGEGSDVMVFNPYYFNSFYKAITSGGFCDMTELIAKDETFKNLNLNPKIIDSARYDGALYYIPLGYSFPTVVTYGEVLQKNGITVDPSAWTQENFKKIILDCAAKNKTGNKYFLLGMSFNSFMQFSGKSFIDMANKTCSFDSEEFVHMMETYKDIRPYIMPDKDVPPTEIGETLIKNGSLLMCTNSNFSFNNLHAEYSMAENLLKYDLKLFPYPQYEKSEEFAYNLSDVASINQNCSDKAAALDFIEMLLSVDIQRYVDKHGNQNIRGGMPVNLDAIKADIEYFKSPETGAVGNFTTNGNITYASAAFSNEFGSMINEFNGKLGSMEYIDTEILKIISDGAESYFNGKSSAEQAAKDIQEKVTLFLNE